MPRGWTRRIAAGSSRPGSSSPTESQNGTCCIFRLARVGAGLQRLAGQLEIRGKGHPLGCRNSNCRMGRPCFLNRIRISAQCATDRIGDNMLVAGGRWFTRNMQRMARLDSSWSEAKEQYRVRRFSGQAASRSRLLSAARAFDRLERRGDAQIERHRPGRSAGIEDADRRPRRCRPGRPPRGSKWRDRPRPPAASMRRIPSASTQSLNLRIPQGAITRLPGRRRRCPLTAVCVCPATAAGSPHVRLRRD
jgi:hypothetical protein